MNFLEIIQSILKFITTPIFFLILLVIILLYHFILLYTKDKIYLNEFKKFDDPESITIEDLKDLPKVTIVVPAWKEGELFKNCLESITKLKYPNLNVIVNAGGDSQTLEIARSFEKSNGFKILHQKGGSFKPSLGKIRALNDCLPYISEGILYFIDADVYITDEVILRLIYPLINQNEYVVKGGIKPLKHQERNDLSKYLEINRNFYFKRKFSRYSITTVSGANTMVKFEVIKKIGKFSEDREFAEDVSRARDILSKGFKIYTLSDYRGRIYCDYSDNIKDWLKQKIRWNQNFIIRSYLEKKILLINSFFLYIVSFLLISSLIFSLFYIIFIYLYLFIISNLYLIKIRKLIFFKKMFKNFYDKKLGLKFFIKLYLYIHIEALVYLFLPFSLISYSRKKRKS